MQGESPCSRRASSTPPELWEVASMRLIAEQGAIPFDQLARFLEVEENRGARIAKHLSVRGYADYGRFLHGEPPLLWLTHRGCRLSGTDFPYVPPRIGALARIRAVNEIRLHISARAPEARWICGRTVFREQGHRGHRPHAVVEIAGERHALLALLGAKKRDLLIQMLEAHMRRYDALVVFSPARGRRALNLLASKRHWPKLVTRELPRPADPSREGGEGALSRVLTR
jgi:hypothetical protein